MRNVFAILILTLTLFVVLILLVVLYSGGIIDVAGIRIPRSKPATFVIALCILIPIYFLAKKSVSIKNAMNENSLLLMICIVLVIYLGNYRTRWASDTVPARHLPVSIIRQANFDLDEFSNLHQIPESNGLTFTGKHYVSSYPVGAAIFALPFYFVSAVGGMPGNSWFTLELEKFAASCIVLVSIVILYLTLLRLGSRSAALIIAIIYALGTSSFSVSSQALWQHGPSQLCLTATLYCLVRGSKEPIWTSFAGFPAAFAVVCRPTDALLVAPMGLYVLFHQTRQFPRFLLCAVPPVLFQMVYNNHYFDNPFRTQFKVAQERFWSTPLFEGLANILFSPGRGLFVYSPIFILSIIGIVLTWTSSGQRKLAYQSKLDDLPVVTTPKSGMLLLRYLSIGVIANILLYSKFFSWWGGYTYGPRLLADLSPILCLFLYETKSLFNKTYFKIAFFVLAAFSITAHAIGAYGDQARWNVDLDINRHPNVAWYWTDNQLINPPKKLWNSIQIQALNLPTTGSNPELLDAEIRSDPEGLIFVRPLKELGFAIQLKNSGKAVWLDRAAENGAVHLRLDWYRKDRFVERFSTLRRLRYQLMPGQSTNYFVRLYAPEKEGRYILEIALTLIQNKSEVKRTSLAIPVRVAR